MHPPVRVVDRGPMLDDLGQHVLSQFLGHVDITDEQAQQPDQSHMRVGAERLDITTVLVDVDSFGLHNT